MSHLCNYYCNMIDKLFEKKIKDKFKTASDFLKILQQIPSQNVHNVSRQLFGVIIYRKYILDLVLIFQNSAICGYFFHSYFNVLQILNITLQKLYIH